MKMCLAIPNELALTRVARLIFVPFALHTPLCRFGKFLNSNSKIIFKNNYTKPLRCVSNGHKKIIAILNLTN